MGQPLEACSETRRVEVHEKPCGAARQFQISNCLCQVNGMNALDRLDLDDQVILDQQIDLQAACKPMLFVRQSNEVLVLDTELRVLDFNEQAISIH